MQNLPIPTQIINSAGNTTAPGVTGTPSSSNNALDEGFSKIMAKEIANDTAMAQQNNTATGVEQTPVIAPATIPATILATSHANNLQPNLANQHYTVTPGMHVDGKYIEQSTSNEQKLALNHSLKTNQHATQTTLSPLASNSQNSSLNQLGQTNNPANFAAFSKIMPPTAEMTSNTMLPIFDESAVTLNSDPAQPVNPNGTSILTPTSPSSLPTVHSAPDVSLDTQFGQPKWGDDFAQKIVWLTNQHQQVAEIKLNPAHLGPIEIILSISNDQSTQANAQFVSSHLAVREAIEAALPRLREMMAENGITLGDVTIDANASQQQKDSRQQENTSGGFSNGQSENNYGSIDQSKTITRTSNHLGIVNTFA